MTACDFSFDVFLAIEYGTDLTARYKIVYMIAQTITRFTQGRVFSDFVVVDVRGYVL